ncbi:putative short-chain dehydrogenase [Thozetella sp. PMI_491]|nr:putative short-chain dehydrogenase [Thozetella sp. PMI_491]
MVTDAFAPYKHLYADPQGPGDARPTAQQIVKDNDLLGKWAGKVALVTGATSGIGIETARALHMTGADVYFTARDMSKAASTREYILQHSEGKGKLEAIKMEMESLESVKKAAKEFLERSNVRLNVLICNAAIMGAPQGETHDGFELHFAVNHLAHFTLTFLVLPALMDSSSPDFNSRVVVVSSSAHRWTSFALDDYNYTLDYKPYMAYGRSKIANIWMANYINRMYGAKGVNALSLNPGGIWTGLQKYATKEDMENWKSDGEIMKIMQSPEQGASTTVWAAAGKVWEGQGGKFLSACALAPMDTGDLSTQTSDGYAPWAYDEDGETKLWELSVDLAGLKEEE